MPIASVLLAALLPGTLPWDFPADIASEQYRELTRFFESYDPGQPSAPDPARVRLAIGANHTFLPPSAKLTPAGPNAWQVEWPLMQIGSAPATRGNNRTRVHLRATLKRLGSAVPEPVTILLGPVAAPPGTATFRLLTAADEPRAQPWVRDRSWLFRLATQTGHHLIGSEAQLVSAAVDYLEQQDWVDREQIGAAGAGSGRLPALHAAALDPRIKSVWAAPEESPVYDSPEDRMIWRERVDIGGLGSLLAGRARTATRADEPPDPRYNAHFREWEAWYRNVALETYAARARSFPPPREAWEEQTGRFPKPYGSFDARSVESHDTAEVTGYRLRVRVYDGVHAYGILLIPRKLDRTRRHPLVFVQHGLGGVPEDILGVDGRGRADEVYRKLGMMLARRGYLVFAPMISTQDGWRRNSLVRRAHPLGLTPAGVERVKFSRLLDFFETLPFVDKNRFGFYGLSYGGYTALWTTPGEPRFRVVVSSGHFNDWTAKTTDPTIGTSYLYYPDHLDMYNHGTLTRFSHAGLAALIHPRPLLIEMGDRDGVMVEPRRLVEAELAEVARLYDRAGMSDRFAVARFDGPHRIDGGEAVAFLAKWLSRP